MKKFIVFLILMITIIPTVVNADTINSINMNIYIDNSGDAKFTEVWSVTATEKTEYYHSYYNLGNSTIQNLKVSDEDREYETLTSWNVNGSFETKKYKCGLNHVSGGVEVCWGKSDYGRKTYTVEYEITNFVSSLEDAQMAYWTLIPEGHDKFGKVDIEIKSDFAYENTLDVWGYGNYGGLCYVSDGTIKMSTNGEILPSSNYMTILVKFPEGTFNVQNKINENFKHYLDMAEEGAKHYTEIEEKETNFIKKIDWSKIWNNIIDGVDMILKVIFMIVIYIIVLIIFCVLTILLSCILCNFFIGIFLRVLLSVLIMSSLPHIYPLTQFTQLSDLWCIPFAIIEGCNICGCFMFYREMKNSITFGKEGENKIKNAEYYRDIPCDRDLFKTYYIASSCELIKNKTDFLGAIFLKWLKEKKISIIKRKNENDEVEECIKFNLSNSEIKEIISNQEDILDEERRRVLKFENTSRKGLKVKEIYYDFEDRLLKYIVQASQDGILEKKELEKWCKKNYYVILNWFDRVIRNEEYKIIKNGNVETIKRGKIFKTKRYIYDSDILNEAINLSGLEKFLKDYTLIHDREAIEVELFEDYLIYAQILGIAKEVKQEFKDLYPYILEQSSFESFDNVDLLVTCANNGMSSAKSAKFEAMRSSSDSYSGGGRRLFIRRRSEVAHLVAEAGMGSR